MRTAGKWVLRGLMALVLFVVLAFALDPRDDLANPAVATPPSLGADLDAYLASAESGVPNIRDGAQKRIVWAGAKGQKTPLAIVYLHGFSASSAEIRPVPERVAAALGANLYFARLKGHGQDGPAMATATMQDWLNDAAEAMEIGRALGDRVIVIGTSTGATLATIVAQDQTMQMGLAGMVFVSPNYGVAALAGKILDMPYARIWGPWVAGAQRSFAPHNAEHGQNWTTAYPTAALFPMAQLVRMAKGVDHSTIQTPVLTLLSPNDKVVSPAATRAIMSRWGGAVQMEERVMTPTDDPYSHVIAGDILSPAQTADTVAFITTWARGL